jgi:hypothetical protein
LADSRRSSAGSTSSSSPARRPPRARCGRLHSQTGRPAHLPVSGDLIEDLTPLLGELGYLGVFDGEAALFPGVGKR